MPINRKEHNRIETRRHIRNIFLELYSKSGIDGVTISSLCQQAGIVKSTFYSYYEDKYAVLEEIEQELLSNLATINSKLEIIDVTTILQGKPLPQASKSVDYILAHLDEFRIIMGPMGDLRFENIWRRNISDSFKGRFLKEKGDSRSAGLACTIFSSTLIGIYRYFIFEAPDITKEEFTLILGNTFKYALMDFKK